MARRSGRATDYRWTLGRDTSLALASGSDQGTILAAPTVSSVTLMRQRGEVLIWMDGTPVPGAAIRFGVGLILNQDGVTATNLPLDDGQAPWIWYAVGSLAYDEPVVDVIDIPLITAVRLVIDGKAMRKIRSGVEVTWVIQQETIGSGNAINASILCRFLVGE